MADERRPIMFPSFRYRDAHAAIEWLERTFGFTRQAVHPGPDGGVGHAELRLGSGTIMLGSLGAPDPANPWTTATHGVYVYVADVEAHYRTAKATGADIVRDLADTPYGSREYSARDLDGNLWSFGTYYPEPSR